MAEGFRVLLLHSCFQCLCLWSTGIATSTCSDRTGDKCLRIGLLLPLGGSMSYNLPESKEGCNMALEHINNSDFLPGYELEFDVKNASCDEVKGNIGLWEILENESKVVALVGAGCSTATRPMSESSSHWNLVQFGFISSSPSLQSKEECPTYPNYFSVVPTEYSLNPARRQLMECFGWSKAIIFHGTENIWSKTAEDLMINSFSDYQLVAYSVSDDLSIKEKMQKAVDTKIRVLFILAYDGLAAKLLCQGYRSGIRSTTHTWIFMYVGNNAEWYLKENKKQSTGCTDSQLRQAANSLFTLDIAQHDPQHVNVTLPTNKTVSEVAKEIKKRYPDRNVTDLELVFKDYFGYGYDTTVAVAKMLKMYIEKNSTLPKLQDFQYTDIEVYQQLYGILNNSMFDFSGITGTISFHERKCLNTFNWGLIVIRYNRNGNSTKIFQVNVANSSAKECRLLHEPNWPDGSRPSDFPESRLSSVVAFGVILGFSCIGIILAVVFLVYGIVHRNIRIFRLSGAKLNAVVAIAAIAGYLGIIFDGLNGQFFDLQLWSCFAKIFLYALCFVGTFGVVLVQMWAVSLGVKKHDHEKPRRRISTTRIKLTEQNLLVMVLLMLAVDVIIIIIWFSIDRWETGTRPLESGQFSTLEQDRCTCDNFWIWVYVFSVYKGILMAFGVYLAYDTRQIRVPFLTNSRLMAVASYTAVACCLMLFILLHVDMTDPSVYYVLTSILCLMFCTVPLLLIYLPKIYVIKFRPEKTVGGIGPARGVERGSMSEHTIASTQKINLLKKRNAYQREVIQMLIEERNICEETVQRITEELNLDAENEGLGTSESLSTSRDQTYSESSEWLGSDSRKESVFGTTADNNNDKRK